LRNPEPTRGATVRLPALGQPYKNCDDDPLLCIAGGGNGAGQADDHGQREDCDRSAHLSEHGDLLVRRRGASSVAAGWW